MMRIGMATGTGRIIPALALISGCVASPEDANQVEPATMREAQELPGTRETRLRTADEVLEDLERLDLAPDERQAVEHLQVAMWGADRWRRFRSQLPVAVMRIDGGPANLRAAPRMNAPVIAVLETGTVVSARMPAGRWWRVEVINSADGYIGYVHADLLVSDQALGIPVAGADQQFDAALTSYRETLSSSASFQCLDDLKLCKQRHSWFDCELVMIVCIGEAFVGSFN